MKERQILDRVLIVNEVIHSKEKLKKRKGLFFNVDTRKAYDHVERNFIGYMLHRMGFGKRLRISIRKYLSTTSFFNTSKWVHKGYSTSRDLWQGDPLSAFFIHNSDRIIKPMETANRETLINGFAASISKRSMYYSPSIIK